MTRVDFKTPAAYKEYFLMPYRLIEMTQMFCEISSSFGIIPVVTRIREPVEGESGVHRDGRAIDFRDEMTTLQRDSREFQNVFLYTLSQRKKLIDEINAAFPRRDGLKTIMHHSFNSGPHHFHVQVSYKDSLVPKPVGFGIIEA